MTTRTKKINDRGPLNARILVIGEAPGKQEEEKGVPFAGGAGGMLQNWLTKAGADPVKDVYYTNVCKYRPHANKIEHFFTGKKSNKSHVHGQPNEKITEGVAELHALIDRSNFDLIICLGTTSLWALDSSDSITKWRGSCLYYKNIKVLPTYHPAFVMRQYQYEPICQGDINKAIRFLSKPWPKTEYEFTAPTDFIEARSKLCGLLHLLDTSSELVPIAFDIETVRRYYLETAGLAWKNGDSYHSTCIPFIRDNGDQAWTLDQEVELVKLFRFILCHPNAYVIGQNILYDAYFVAKRWGFMIPFSLDTMIANHVLFPLMKKSLDFLASVYIEDYVYWKDERKERERGVDELQGWEYNGKDTHYTLRLGTILKGLTSTMGFQEQLDFQMQKARDILPIELTGTLINQKRRTEMMWEVTEKLQALDVWFFNTLPEQYRPVAGQKKANLWESPTQLATLLYEEMGLPVQRNKKTKRPSTDDDSLNELIIKVPLLAKFFRQLLYYRTLKLLATNFLSAKLDTTGRLCTHYNPAGTVTYRLASSKTAFDEGANKQNIPKDSKEKDIPPIRSMFQPDPGYTIVCADLDRADVQVVAARSGCVNLKNIFRLKQDLHTMNACSLFNCSPEEVDYDRRQLAKAFCHATNYGASDYALSRALGLPKTRCAMLREQWFKSNPELADWHDWVWDQLVHERQLRSVFGFVFRPMGRFDKSLLKEALAWEPQHTVAQIIDRGWRNLTVNMSKDVQVLMQVHDELIMQVKTSKVKALLPDIQQEMLITCPFDEPLTIPVGFKTSTISWQHAKDVDMDNL